MASGTFEIKTNNQYISGYVLWTEGNQTVSSNNSYVAATGYLRRTNTYTGTPSSNTPTYVTIVINGETTDFDLGTVTIPNDGTYVQVGTTGKWIQHENDGTKNITISYQMSNPNGNGAFTVPVTSATVTLDTIPRYANFTSHYVESTTQDSITVYWSADATCDSAYYSLNGSSEWLLPNSLSGNRYTIKGLQSGKTYSIVTHIHRVDSGLWTSSSPISGTTQTAGVKIKVNGVWKDAVPYIKVNGTWKRSVPYINVNGTWKKGI